MLAIVVALVGCDINEEEIEKETLEFAKSQEEDKIVRPYDDVVSNVDFSKPHIQIEFRDKFTIDADIFTEIPDNLGVYEYEDLWVVTEEDDSMEDKVAQLIDEYFGEAVSVTSNDPKTVETEYGLEFVFNVAADTKSISFGQCNTVWKYKDGLYWETRYPYIDGEYDEIMIEDKIQEFVKHFESILPENLSDKYRCLHFDDLFWKTSGAGIKENEIISNSMDRDFYWIRMYCEIEQDVYYSKGYSPLLIGKIGESSWPQAFKDYDYPKNALYNIYLDAYVDIYLDENGEIFAFEIINAFDIGDCVEVGEIISVKDALGTVYEVYADMPVYEQITGNEIKLAYSIIPGNTVDENGYREAYIRPIWFMYYIKGDHKYECKCIAVDAVTGKVIYR